MHTTKTNSRRGMGRILAAAAIAATALLFTSTAASADDASPSASDSSSAATYVYWSYWSGNTNGEWTFGQKGAGDITPADGTVEGWAYSGGSDGSISQPPRIAADFDQICGNTDPVDGKKRVAVVVDFGTTAVAPAGATPPVPAYDCVTADPNANGVQVLADAQPVRSTPAGQVCGINNYPASGCGEQVPLSAVNAIEEAPGDTAGESTADTSSLPTWAPFAIGAVILIALAGTAIAMSRRRNG